MGASQGQQIAFEPDVRYVQSSSSSLFQCCNLCRRDDTLAKSPIIISHSESPGLSPGKIGGGISADINEVEALGRNIDPDFVDLGREPYPTVEPVERETRMRMYLEALEDESADSKLRPGRISSGPIRGLPRPEKDVLSAKDVARIFRDPGGGGGRTAAATSSAFTSLDPLARNPRRRGGRDGTASRKDQKNNYNNPKTSTSTSSDEGITERWQ
eukprot:jgi/Bigna1/140091/aug1.54_g14799